MLPSETETELIQIRKGLFKMRKLTLSSFFMFVVKLIFEELKFPCSEQCLKCFIRFG